MVSAAGSSTDRASPEPQPRTSSVLCLFRLSPGPWHPALCRPLASCSLQAQPAAFPVRALMLSSWTLGGSGTQKRGWLPPLTPAWPERAKGLPVRGGHREEVGGHPHPLSAPQALKAEAPSRGDNGVRIVSQGCIQECQM